MVESHSLEGFNSNGEAPKTEAFKEAVERGNNDLDEWLQPGIENNRSSPDLTRGARASKYWFIRNVRRSTDAPTFW
jgi:hypothetical protein